jgi:hypothetical protein
VSIFVRWCRMPRLKAHFRVGTDPRGCSAGQARPTALASLTNPYTLVSPTGRRVAQLRSFGRCGGFFFYFLLWDASSGTLLSWRRFEEIRAFENIFRIRVWALDMWIKLRTSSTYVSSSVSSSLEQCAYHFIIQLVYESEGEKAE